MIPLIVTPDLRQACPSCFPGDRDALEPLSTVSTGATLRAAYRCPCGYSWALRWSADSPWPLRTEPVPLAELLCLTPLDGAA